MRGAWSTLALVGVLAALGAYIYFVDSERPASGIEEKQKVFTVQADTIEEVTISADSESATVRKTDGTWKLTAPVQADADQNELSTITNAIASLEVNRVVDENAADLVQYGLGNPRIVIDFKAAGGASGQLHLGDKTATQSDLYAVKPGEKRVFLVQAYQESTFLMKPFDLRDKRVLAFERDKVDTIEIAEKGAMAVQLARAGSNWVVKAPIQARGDYSAVEGLISRLSTTNMSKLIDGGLDPKYGLDPAAVSVTFGAGSSRATLALGVEEAGAVYAKDQSRPAIFAVEPSVLTDLKRTADDYRSKDLFEFRSFNADRLRIVRGGDVLEFLKVAGTGENAAEKWQRLNGSAPATDVDSTKMDDLLTKLTSLRAQAFRPVTGAGIGPQQIVVGASFDQGKFERVRLAKPAAEAVATRDGEPGVAVLDATAYDDMVKALDAVLAPPDPAPAANITPPGPTLP
jgi:hypothetical protein